MNADDFKKLIQDYSLASARYAAGAGRSDDVRLQVTTTCMAAFAAVDKIFAANAELKAKLSDENAALVFRCANVAQEEAHRWEGSALSASESDSDYDLKNEQWARSNAEVARRIEHKIRSLAPKAEASIAAAMAREGGK